jgi:hypothetical protein
MLKPLLGPETYKDVLSKKLRRSLDFDGDIIARPLASKAMLEIVATHGMSIRDMSALAVHGRFTRVTSLQHTGDPGNNFFLTPNPLYKDFLGDDPRIGDKHKLVIEDFEQVDVIRAGVDYAQDDEEDENGVVVVFGADILHSKYNPLFSSDGYGKHTSIDGSYGVELVLSRAPSIQSIKGIYPITSESREAAEKILKLH